MKNIVLKIDGMTCAGCAKSVKRALSTLEGVSDADVNFEAGEAKICFDDEKIASQTLIEAVEDAGFDAVIR